MVEVLADLWTFHRRAPICITTNGSVTKHGLAVMGRGCAREAKERVPSLPALLGDKIRKHGNHVYWWPDLELITFPVKHQWYERADLDLIRKSARVLVFLADEFGWKQVVLPRPGCGNGGRAWETEVKPILADILDDRFLVISRREPTARE